MREKTATQNGLVLKLQYQNAVVSESVSFRLFRWFIFREAYIYYCTASSSPQRTNDGRRNEIDSPRLSVNEHDDDDDNDGLCMTAFVVCCSSSSIFKPGWVR